MEKQMQLPTPGTKAYDLLALTALSGEYPASSVSRLIGRIAYAEKVVARLKADGLLRTVYRDKLRGYRLTAAAKHRLLVTDPSRFAFYLTGSTDTNRVKSEPIRRLRLHRVAQVYTSVYEARITLFRNEKPCPFSAAALHHSSPAAFYGSREVKEMGVETVKIRGSRMVGVLAAPGGQIEQDAMTAVGQPVLFACLPDLPRLFRFCSALELYDRQGVLVCFDFQAAALKQGCA